MRNSAFRFLILIALVFVGSRFDHHDAVAGLVNADAGHSHGIAVGASRHHDHAPEPINSPDEEDLSAAFHCGSSVLLQTFCGISPDRMVRSSYGIALSAEPAMSAAVLEPPPPRV